MTFLEKIMPKNCILGKLHSWKGPFLENSVPGKIAFLEKSIT